MQKQTKITILYDNESPFDILDTGWGFSCLVEKEEDRLLLDTGWNGDHILDNARRLGVALNTVTSIVISHEHQDHMGGLARILEAVDIDRVFVPASASTKLKDEIAARSELIEVLSERSIGQGITSTGEMDGGNAPKEQSLLIEVSRGVIVVTGCAHPGLDRILDRAASKGRVKAAIGGFHGFEAFDRLEGIDRIVPCHCTIKKDAILNRFPDRATRGGAGLVLEFE